MKESLLREFDTDTILDSVTDGVVAIGLDHRVLYANRAAREILGRGGAEGLAEGARCGEVMGHSGCTLSCLIDRTLKTGEHLHNHEVTFGRGDRALRLSINTAILKDRNGKVTGGVEIFRDVTLVEELKSELRGRYSFENITGRNHRMHEVFELLREVAPTGATVLVEGETGTGKELIANAIHHNSPRSEGPLVKVNCAALSEGLLESELFGHVKGAFTGAVSDRAGRFEIAHGGTIFLDEVGEISPRVQVRLLRVLQEGEYERVGETKTRKTDARVVAATNRDLAREVERGRFREDLYYRLRVVPVRVPPLRERLDDVPLLVERFVEDYNREMGRKITGVTDAAMELLTGYDYPGNVRELRHIIEHGFVRCRGKAIGPEHLPSALRERDLVGRALEEPDPLKALERELVAKVLEETGWRPIDAARRLGMSRTTLWRRMKEHGLEREGPAS